LQLECQGCQLNPDEARSVSSLDLLILLPHKYGDQITLLRDNYMHIFSENSKILDPINFLIMIGKEQKFEITFHHGSGKAPPGHHCCLIEMNTNKNAICVGFSENSFIDAKNDACKNALEYLRIVTE